MTKPKIFDQLLAEHAAGAVAGPPAAADEAAGCVREPAGGDGPWEEPAGLFAAPVELDAPPRRGLRRWLGQLACAAVFAVLGVCFHAGVVASGAPTWILSGVMASLGATAASLWWWEREADGDDWAELAADALDLAEQALAGRGGVAAEDALRAVRAALGVT